MSLNVIGLMCLPPADSNSNEHFKILKIITEQLNLKELSMGMSSDYEQAILNGSTYLRIGTLILGKRNFTWLKFLSYYWLTAIFLKNLFLVWLCSRTLVCILYLQYVKK